MKKILLFTFGLSVIFFSCKYPEGCINIYKLDYSIDHSSAPYDVYFYLDVDYEGPDDALQVSWNFGDRTTSNELMPMHTYYKDEVYTVTLRLVNYDMAVTKTITIDLTKPHTPVSQFEWYPVDDNPNMIAPAEVQFMNFSKFVDSCFWNFGDGTGSAEIEPTHLYEYPDYYFVTLTVFSGTDTVKTTHELDVNSPEK